MKVKEKSGVAFEKLVTRIQQQLDPTAKVTHNEILIDRLGHKRQFDVVIRGMLAGYPMLGVIECKDLKRNVGTSAIEAFVTKSRDVNANLKVLVSKRGFSRQALEKARDYPDDKTDSYLYRCAAHNESGIAEAPVDLPKTGQEMRLLMSKTRVESPVKDSIVSSAAKAGLGWLDFIACRHFRTPPDPAFWQNLGCKLMAKTADETSRSNLRIKEAGPSPPRSSP